MAPRPPRLLPPEAPPKRDLAFLFPRRPRLESSPFERPADRSGRRLAASTTRGGVVMAGAAVTACLLLAGAASAHTHHAQRAWVSPRSVGALDCNGMSPIQSTIESAKACTDIRGVLNSTSPYMDDGHFYDNGRYIGHDEPDTRFLSGMHGSGNNVVFRETLGRDPKGAPTVRVPGRDRTHWVELSVAPWFSMALCNQF